MDKKGKILKIKLGYNPNSSSIGTDIVIFFVSFTAISAVFNCIATFLIKQFNKNESVEEAKKK